MLQVAYTWIVPFLFEKLQIWCRGWVCAFAVWARWALPWVVLCKQTTPFAGVTATFYLEGCELRRGLRSLTLGHQRKLSPGRSIFSRRVKLDLCSGRSQGLRWTQAPLRLETFPQTVPCATGIACWALSTSPICHEFQAYTSTLYLRAFVPSSLS